MRLCVDFRQLNKRTIFESCPPPKVNDCLDRLGGSKIFTTLDLNYGYHQIPLDVDSRKYTAFTSPLGKFEYKYLPFGLKNAPAHFQALMFIVLQKFIDKCVVVYMDDIVVFSENKDDHYNFLKQVLLQLAKYGLCINYEKCSFMRENIHFLGYSITYNKVFPGIEKQNFFRRLQPIRSIKALHSLLGLINYYRGFIPNYSELVYRLYRMVNKIEEFNNEIVDTNLNKIVKFLEGKAFLTLPDFEKQFIIESDASNIGIEGILKQNGKDKELIVRHTSRTLKGAEKNYSTIEKELLAIIFCLTKFKHYLGGKFILRTDHKPLTYLRNIKEPKGKFSRWILFLEQFDFEIVYKQGKTNYAADLLSRFPALENNLIATVNEPYIKDIAEAHQLCWHGCANVTYLFFKQNYKNIPKFKDVKTFISKCTICLRRNPNKRFEIYPIVRNKPFTLIGIDTIGLLSKTDRGNKYIVLATDYATGWVEGRALSKKSAYNIAQFLLSEIFCRHGPPTEIRSDLGTKYNAEIVKTLANKWGSKMRYTAPYTPRSNGKAERSNATLINKLSKLIEREENWDDILDFALFSFRISPQEKIGTSPFHLLYGRTPFINIGGDYKMNNKGDSETHSIDQRLEIGKTMDELIKTKNSNYLKRIDNMNKNRASSEDIQVGDMVLYKNRFNDNKFGSKWIGPFRVTEFKGNGTYVIKSIETGVLIKTSRLDIKYFTGNNDGEFYSVLSEPETRREGVLPNKATLTFKIFRFT